MEIIIGSHVSYTKKEGLLGSVKEALSYNANTFMIYTGAPQNTIRYEIDDDLTNKAEKLMEENNIKEIIIHAPYIINLANHKNHEFSVEFLKKELERAQKLHVNKVVLHPGSHVGLGEEEGIKNIISALNKVLIDKGPIICLETMAKKGSEIGTIDELKQIIEGVQNKERIGLCLDTCHLNDAGYDISNFDEILKEIDEKIGIYKIKCIHLNDSKNIKGAHKDRHENIGIGQIGFENLIKVIYNEKLKDVPKILETPYIDKKYPPYKFEIQMIKEKKFNKNLYEDIINYYK